MADDDDVMSVMLVDGVVADSVDIADGDDDDVECEVMVIVMFMYMYMRVHIFM